MLFFLRFETVRLYSSANNVDPEIAEFVLEMFFAIVCFVGTTAVLIIFFEFLYKKYKPKDTITKNYPKFWIIIFWIGTALGLIPILICCYSIISTFYEEIQIYLSNFDIRYLLPPK